MQSERSQRYAIRCGVRECLVVRNDSEDSADSVRVREGERLARRRDIWRVADNVALTAHCLLVVRAT